ncbi:hypothetical protein [Streptomonospora wellingtoniae]|uniref:Uncharacterized protein n=1 Tax=Streptomonospora wellingtoniae TaxID=3075544 RepID=A0ABU2L1B4_9ACTN|nr:hypothetical protein [Streptomonospora sp. DSM 45055]MDT0305048.1 hypothetical protein [Streptomonospora sp. DSM 45055]
MRRLSRIVQEWRDRVLPPPTGRHAAATAPAPAPEVEAPAEPPATQPIPTVPLYTRRRIVPPWAPPAAPADDGLDDLRAALAGPIRALIADRPDLAHPAPDAGTVRELAVR